MHFILICTCMLTFSYLHDDFFIPAYAKVLRRWLALRNWIVLKYCTINFIAKRKLWGQGWWMSYMMCLVLIIFSLERNTESLKHVFNLNYRIKSCEGVGYIKKVKHLLLRAFQFGARELFNTSRLECFSIARVLAYGAWCLAFVASG